MAQFNMQEFRSALNEALAPIHKLAAVVAADRADQRARQRQLEDENRRHGWAMQEYQNRRQDTRADIKEQRDREDKIRAETRKNQLDDTASNRQFQHGLIDDARLEKDVDATQARNQKVDDARAELWKVSGYADIAGKSPADGTLDDDVKARELLEKKLDILMQAHDRGSEKVAQALKLYGTNTDALVRSKLSESIDLVDIFGDDYEKYSQALKKGTMTPQQIASKLDKKERARFLTVYSDIATKVGEAEKNVALQEAGATLRESLSRYEPINQAINRYTEIVLKHNPSAVANVIGKKQGPTPTSGSPDEDILRGLGFPAAPQPPGATVPPPEPRGEVPQAPSETSVFAPGSTGILPALDRSVTSLKSQDVTPLEMFPQAVAETLVSPFYTPPEQTVTHAPLPLPRAQRVTQIPPPPPAAIMDALPPGNGAIGDLAAKQAALQRVFGTSDMSAITNAKSWFMSNSGMNPEAAQQRIDSTLQRAFTGDPDAIAEIRNVMIRSQNSIQPAPTTPAAPNGWKFVQPVPMPTR